MTWIGLGLLLVLILFGGPALAAAIRNQIARRREAAQARRKEEEERKQQALAARQQVEYTWRNSPDRAGVGEYLRYLAMKAPLQHAANEARRRLEQRSEQVDHCLSRYPGGAPPSTRYRLAALAGFAFFLGAFALALTLDYLIFRGLHPQGSMVLPFGLACLAVMGITVSSVIMFGVKRHDLLPRKTSHYYRQVVILGGGLLAVCIAGYMMMIAPNRSYPAGQAAIAQAEQVLQADQSAIPASSPQLIALDQSAVSQAKANLARAQQVDRLSAGALAFVEIPLSEAAVLGGELLVLYLAVARREQARQVKQRAEDAVAQRDARFVAELTQILINQGRGEESVRRIIDRGNAMNSFASLSLGRPTGPGADLPIQHRQRAHRLPVLAGVTRYAHSLGVNGQRQPTAPALAPLPVGVPQPPDQPGPHHGAESGGANGFQDPADYGLSGRLEPPAELMPTDAERRQDLQQHVRGPLADRGDRPGLGKRRRRRG